MLTFVTGSLLISQYSEPIRRPRSTLGQGAHLTLPLSTQQLNDTGSGSHGVELSRTASVGL